MQLNGINDSGIAVGFYSRPSYDRNGSGDWAPEEVFPFKWDSATTATADKFVRLGSLSTTGLRLGGDFGTTSTQNLALGATFNLAPAAGGLTFAGNINSVTSNTSVVSGNSNHSNTNIILNRFTTAPL